MNTSSFLIVGGATALGATALYLAIQFGMNASDEYASKLSVTSQEYLKLRAKALAMGEDPTKIKDNAARSQRPANYNVTLSASTTSPYIRPDSDEVAAKKAGLSEEELQILMKKAMAAGDVVKEEEEIYVPNIDLDGDGNYTVHDEIRLQLATEEMSDEKREMLEALLPKDKPEPVRAVNVTLKFDTKSCVVPRNSNSLIGVMFRHKSQAIRGRSLNDLDDLINMRERCDGTLVLEDNNEALSESDIELRESRRDEVKYYLLQRQVPKENIVVGSL